MRAGPGLIAASPRRCRAAKRRLGAGSGPAGRRPLGGRRGGEREPTGEWETTYLPQYTEDNRDNKIKYKESLFFSFLNVLLCFLLVFFHCCLLLSSSCLLVDKSGQFLY